METAKVGKRGAIVVPAKLRRRFGIEEGTVVTAEEREDGILIRPAVVVPIEKYTPERKAEPRDRALLGGEIREPFLLEPC